MNEHEIAHLASQIAEHLKTSHVCKFSEPERAAVHQIAPIWLRFVRYAGAGASTIIIAALTAVGGAIAWVIWLGVRAALVQ